MFAPNPAQAAAELLGVCRPSGTLALTAWTPDGWAGGVPAEPHGAVRVEVGYFDTDGSDHLRPADL